MNPDLTALKRWIRDGGNASPTERMVRSLEAIALDIRSMRLAGGMTKRAKRSSKRANPPDWAVSDTEKQAAIAVLHYLNKRAGRSFKPVDSNLKLIIRLMRDGFEAEDFKRAVDSTVEQWRGDPKMEQFLRPATIFGPENFAQKYSGQRTEEDD